MAITTYITSTEATYFYANDQSYLAARRSNALSHSYQLVNSYINSALKAPQVGQWDGVSSIEVPAVLKIAQAKFYQYILEFSNVGHTDELKSLYESAVELCKGLTQNELSLPAWQTFQGDVGWHIVSSSNATNEGGVYVRGGAPNVRTYYKLVISSTGKDYPADLTFDVFRSDDDTARVSDQAASWDWTIVDSAFEIRWDGQWTENDTVYIVGIPQDEVNAASPQRNYLRQVGIAY